MLAYLRSESGNSGPRICTASNLSAYWSGADPYEAERQPPVCLPGLLSASEIGSCHAAAGCLGRRAQDGDVCAALAHEWYDRIYSPDHVVCYLHRGAGLTSHCPGLLEKLVQAMTAPHPGVAPSRVPLHVRCSELHAYAVGGALLDEGHKDNGSKRTLIVQVAERPPQPGTALLASCLSRCASAVPLSLRLSRSGPSSRAEAYRSIRPLLK